MLFIVLYHPLPSRKNKLTESMFFSQLPDLLDYCNTLTGLISILGNFHLDKPKNLNTSSFYTSFVCTAYIS